DGIRVFHVTGVQTCALPIQKFARFYPTSVSIIITKTKYMKLKFKSSAILYATLLVGSIGLAQDAVVEDFKKTATTQEGKEYPQVNSEGRVRVQISAPEAKKVQLDIGAVKY